MPASPLLLLTPSVHSKPGPLNASKRSTTKLHPGLLLPLQLHQIIQTQKSQAPDPAQCAHETSGTTALLQASVSPQKSIPQSPQVCFYSLLFLFPSLLAGFILKRLISFMWGILKNVLKKKKQNVSKCQSTKISMPFSEKRRKAAVCFVVKNTS